MSVYSPIWSLVHIGGQLELLNKAAWAVAVLAVRSVCRKAMGKTPCPLAVWTRLGRVPWVFISVSERVPKHILRCKVVRRVPFENRNCQ